jgi:hypothetical protein
LAAFVVVSLLAARYLFDGILLPTVTAVFCGFAAIRPRRRPAFCAPWGCVELRRRLEAGMVLLNRGDRPTGTSPVEAVSGRGV